MLRSLKAFTTLAFIRPLSLYRSSLLTQSRFHFNSFMKHPFVERLQTVSSPDEFEEAITQIAKLNDKNKESAIRIILQLVKEKTIPPKFIVHDKITYFISKFPILHIESLLFRIELQLVELSSFLNKDVEEGKQTAIKDINACFTQVFQILKKIPKKDAARTEIDAYKAFAHYHYKTLLRLVHYKQCKAVLRKAIDFYTSALAKIQAQLQRQQQKAAEEGNDKPLPLKNIEQMTPEQLAKVESHISFKRFELAQEYSELLYSLMEAQNYYSDPRIKDVVRPRSKLIIPFEYHQGLYCLQPLFKSALDHYQKVDDLIQSQYYFKIKKTYLQMQHYSLLHQNKDKEGFEDQEMTAFDSRMDEFIEQIAQNMMKLTSDEDSVEVQRNLCLILLSIKSNRLARLNLSRQEFEKRLAEDAKAILEVIENQSVKKLISGNFCLVIKQTTGLDLQKYLGKLPRNPYLKR